MLLYPNAKINIGLNVLEKRADGYHELSSVFYPINDCYDILEIVPSTEFFFSSWPGMINDWKNSFSELPVTGSGIPAIIRFHGL